MREGSPAGPELSLRAEETYPGVPYFSLLLSPLTVGHAPPLPPASALTERAF